MDQGEGRGKIKAKGPLTNRGEGGYNYIMENSKNVKAREKKAKAREAFLVKHKLVDEFGKPSPSKFADKVGLGYGTAIHYFYEGRDPKNMALEKIEAKFTDWPQ